MSLRTKCALLLVAFELTLAATLMLTVRYIGIYFEDAAQAFTRSSAGVADLSRLRTLVRNELAYNLQFVHHPSAIEESRRIGDEIHRAVEDLEQDRPEPITRRQFDTLQSHIHDRQQAVTAFLASSNRAGATSVAGFNPESHLRLDAFLGQLESQMLDHVRQSVESTFIAQKKATLILSVNMVVGALLGILGMVLVRRWVLLPIQELKLTTDELGKGRLDHRARVRSGDEFGQLASAVNKMSTDLQRIERQMILRERAAAMGELVSYIAHNIRNPLAGIRSLADSCVKEEHDFSAQREKQREIVSSIEKMQRWLRELEHICGTLEIRPESVDIRELVDNVIAVFRPMSERRSITLERQVSEEPYRVKVDERHFEQAVAAIVANAIEAVGRNGRVRIKTLSNGDPTHWTLSVSDTGPGIPVEDRQRVLDPAFSTKRGGQGIGLALARKVVELHGGQLSFECPTTGGTIFRLTLPRQPGDCLSHG